MRLESVGAEQSLQATDCLNKCLNFEGFGVSTLTLSHQAGKVARSHVTQRSPKSAPDHTTHLRSKHT